MGCYMRKYLLLSVLHILFATSVAHAGSDKSKVYSIGIVPQFEIRHLRKIWNPILELIEKNTGYRLELKGSPNIKDFGKELKAGNFDFAYMNPYHFILANKAQGYIPLIRDNGRELQGIIVIKKDSPITSIKELNGKKVAFPSPNALGASLLIRSHLKNKFNININPVYVKTHSSVYLNVLLDQATAGGGIYKTLIKQGENIQASLRILHRTPMVSPHPIAAHPRVPLDVRNKIKETLLLLGENSVGQDLLAKIPIKKIGHASSSDYKAIESMNLDNFYAN